MPFITLPFILFQKYKTLAMKPSLS